MISIAEMKELAEKEIKAEKELAKIKYEKDLARYRDKLKEVKPKLMDYIEKCIYNGIKHNSKIGLYIHVVEDIFKSIDKYGDNILYYLADPNRKTASAYEVALKELANEIRDELFKAGVKSIIRNDHRTMGDPYLFLEV